MLTALLDHRGVDGVCGEGKGEGNRSTPGPRGRFPGARRAGVLVVATLLLPGVLAAQASRAPIISPGAGPDSVSALSWPHDPELEAALEGAVRDALGASRPLEAQRIRVGEAEARLAEARALGLPALTLQSRATRVGNGVNLGDAVNPAYAALNALLGEPRFPTDLDLTLPLRYEARVQLLHPLLNRPLHAARAASRAAVEGEVARTGVVARDVVAEVQRAFLAAASAREARRILEAARERALEGERVARRLLDEGLVTPAALLEAQASRALLEGDLAAARSQEDAARWALNRRTGRPPEHPLPPLGGFSNAESPAPGLPPAMVTGATREELLLLDAALRAADAGVRGARAARLPTVGVALDWGPQGQRLRGLGEDPAWSASLVVSFPLFTGGGTRARIAGAELARARLQEERAEVAETLALQLRVAERALEAAGAALPAAQARLDAATELHTLTLRRFEEGLATPFELTEARATLTAAQLGRSLARFALRLAQVEVEYAGASRDPAGPGAG